MSQYTHLIGGNAAIAGARRIGIYDANGNRVGQIPLGNLSLKNTGETLYSFGALSDVHIGQDTASSDFRTALTYLSGCTDFVCICGDLIHGGASEAEKQMEEYCNCVRDCTGVPVYAVSGNHDGAYIASVETTISSITGHPLYYSFTYGDDVFIMVGNKSTVAGSLFTAAELQWLYETLEKNRNKRCFLFQHIRPDDACGNALGIYKTDNWAGTEAAVFEGLLNHYKNTIFFHGHSHLKFYLQEYSDLANIDKSFGRWSIHIPSISVPRDKLSDLDYTITTIYADSEGYIVDVYENGIHLQGRDFVKGEFLPIASYWLDTTLQTIEPNTYVDNTGTLNTSA